jgi:SAM-dependent methyltransferase
MGMESEFGVFNNARDAFNFLRSKYPIRNYLNDMETEHIFIANLIRRFLPKSGRILDLGCGGLNKSALMALLGYEVHGVDDYQDPWHVRDDNLVKLRRFAKDFRITLTIQRPGHYALDYPENYFDGCIISNVIEHLNESPRDLLNNAGLSVREGGYLFVTMPNSVNLRKRLSVLRGKSNYPSVQMFYHCIGSWRGHVREYTLPEQEYILRRNGFAICFSTTYHGMVDRKLKSQFLKYLHKTICCLFPTMRENLATVAQKPPDWKPVEEDPGEFRKSMVGFVPKGVE